MPDGLSMNTSCSSGASSIASQYAVRVAVKTSGRMLFTITGTPLRPSHRGPTTGHGSPSGSSRTRRHVGHRWRPSQGRARPRSRSVRVQRRDPGVEIHGPRDESCSRLAWAASTNPPVQPPADTEFIRLTLRSAGWSRTATARPSSTPRLPCFDHTEDGAPVCAACHACPRGMCTQKPMGAHR